MSKISELNDFKLGRAMGEVTEREKVLKTDNVYYKRGFNLGRKTRSKNTLEEALTDSQLRSQIKALIREYHRTSDSALYAQIIDKYQLLSDRQIKDADDEEFTLLEDKDGDTVLAKKYTKENLASAKDYLNENSDLTIIGKDEDGNVYIGEKDDNAEKKDEKEVIEDSLNNRMENRVMATEKNGYKLLRVSDSKYTVHKDGDASYTLYQVNDHWGCTCSGYYYRGACKHLDMLRGRVSDSELANKEAHTRKEIEQVADTFKTILDGRTWALSGDYRRGAQTVEGATIIVEDSAESFKALASKLTNVMVADGNTIRCYQNNVPVVLIRAADGQMATFLLSTTGSANENKRLRDAAKKKGMRLVENGLFLADGTLLRTPDERSIYQYVGERYKEPWER